MNQNDTKDETVGQSGSEITRIGLVQCTGSKRDEPALARHLYDESDYFVKQRGYVEAETDCWYVQSALHGLIGPDEVIKPYNLRADDLDEPEEWGDHIAEDLAEQHTGAVVEVLGGMAYADPLTPALEARGFDVIEPLRGQPIGQRKRSLLDMTNQDLGRFQ
jgi:hypothetical protein